MPHYQCEVDTVDKRAWHALVERFADANVYQTWSVGAARKGETNLSHLLLKKEGDIVAAAQVALQKIPLIKAGIAHVRFGPMCQLSGRPFSQETFGQAVRALSQEYAERRGLLLRVKPWLAEGQSDVQKTLESAGFRYRRDQPHYQTYIIDLAKPLDALHAGLKPKWRYNLKRAGRHGLTVRETSGAGGMAVFRQLYQEMQDRKAYYDTGEIDFFWEFYPDLPDALTPRIFVCEEHGHAVAAIVISHLGDRAMYLFGATSNRGTALGASYVLHWEGLKWLHQQNCRWYDLEGVSSRGVQQFKAGLTGKSGAEIHMGDFDACASVPSRLIVQVGVGLKNRYREGRRLLSARQSAVR